MDLFRVKKFRKSQKPSPDQEPKDRPTPQPNSLKNENGDMGKSAKADPAPGMENNEDDYDDDEFFTNEVKKKLKELRKNSFMVLIPEESSMDCEDDEEEEEGEGETSSSEWRDMEGEAPQPPWCSFDGVYEQYCERMLFFDRLSDQQLKEVGFHTPLTPSTRSVSRSSSMKLTSPLRCLSLKKMGEPEEETESLQQLVNGPYEDIETVYVAQVCLSWEALRCQYSQLSNKVSCQPKDRTCYSHCAQLFQQFQVLLQRFVENEPFEQGSRAEVYARTRHSLPKLLHVPIVQGSGQKETEEEEPDMLVLAADLIKVMEGSILTFHTFLKMDKRKAKGVVSNLFGSPNQIATPLQLVQSSLDKKKMKLKESHKKRKGGRSKSWPTMHEEVELFFGLIDVKVLSRVLRMAKISKEQLLWCEEKINSLDLLDGKIKGDRSPLLFPC